MGLYNPYWTRKTQGLCKPIWNWRSNVYGQAFLAVN